MYRQRSETLPGINFRRVVLNVAYRGFPQTK